MLLIEIILTLIKYFFMSGADLLQRTVLNVVSAWYRFIISDWLNR